jgi:diacylglycerol kinase (ATP)
VTPSRSSSPLALAPQAGPTPPSPDRGRFRKRPNLLASFRHALHGLVELAAHERNMKLHVWAGLGVAVLGSEVGLSMDAQLAIVLSTSLVLAAEALNSALESLVDLHTLEHREEARRVKDAAAGAVLALAVGAAIVATVIVTRSWGDILPALGQLRAHVPEDAAIVVLGGALLALGRGRTVAKIGAALAGAGLLVPLAMRAVSGPIVFMSLGLFGLATTSALHDRREKAAVP